jgi:hypothetical protein
MVTLMAERDTSTPMAMKSEQRRKVIATNIVTTAMMLKDIQLRRLLDTLAMLVRSFRRLSLPK